MSMFAGIELSMQLHLACTFEDMLSTLPVATLIMDHEVLHKYFGQYPAPTLP